MAKQKLRRARGFVQARKWLRLPIQAASIFLISGPATIPMITGATRTTPGDWRGYAVNIISDMTAIDINSGQLDTTKLIGEVIPRDAALVAAGFFLRWLSKKA